MSEYRAPSNRNAWAASSESAPGDICVTLQDIGDGEPLPTFFVVLPDNLGTEDEAPTRPGYLECRVYTKFVPTTGEYTCQHRAVMQAKITKEVFEAAQADGFAGGLRRLGDTSIVGYIGAMG
jgi:hypothetical protein